jgi:tripartite-type tricarboxylate transporter receptor subunit TctC
MIQRSSHLPDSVRSEAGRPTPARGRRTAVKALAALVVAAQGPAARAQAWPARPIRWVLPSAAGSAPDIIARMLSEKLSAVLGQQVVIDNRPGAAGNIAAQHVARSAADGYTFLFGQASTLAINPYTFKTTGFDADRDFAAVISMGVSPFMFAVTPSLNAQSIAELIALARAEPGKLSFATSASRNLSHISGEMLKATAGINMVHVPYKGSQQAAADTVAGLTHLYIDSIPAMSSYAQSGRLRVIGVSARTRVPGFESVPTINETLPGFEAVGWFAVVAPAGTPADIVERVNRELNAILGQPEVGQRMRGFGMFDFGGSAADLDRFMKAERSKWAKVMREARIEPE